MGTQDGKYTSLISHRDGHKLNLWTQLTARINDTHTTLIPWCTLYADIINNQTGLRGTQRFPAGTPEGASIRFILPLF